MEKERLSILPNAVEIAQLRPDFVNGWIKTCCDAISYENYDYQHSNHMDDVLTDANVLFEGFQRAKQCSSWKPSVQSFELRLLNNLALIQDDFIERTYGISPTYDFILNERGKIRYVSGENVRDRVPKHAICDNILNPELRKYLIYDNSASVKERGITFARNRLETHLHRFYRQNNCSNEGYILIIDFRKYYDNLLHEVLYRFFEGHVSNELCLWFIKQILHSSEIDVSYLSDEQYEDAMGQLFNSLEYHKTIDRIDRSLLTGEKTLKKHLNIGDQVAQIAGITYPIPYDNYVKIVKGEKFFARYMDDSYVIHRSKEHLQELLKELLVVTRELGITINENKTRIVKLSQGWRYLQIKYQLHESGHVSTRINPKRIHAMVRKLPKIAGILGDETEFANYYKSWFNGQRRYMSRDQRIRLHKLYHQIKEEKFRCIE